MELLLCILVIILVISSSNSKEYIFVRFTDLRNNDKVLPRGKWPWLSWIESQDYCQSQYGTDLGSYTNIHDIYHILQQISPSMSIYIGLRQKGYTESDWIWVDGTDCSTKSVYSDSNKHFSKLCINDWDINEPNDKNGEHCAESFQYGAINDIICDVPYLWTAGFICNKPSITTMVTTPTTTYTSPTTAVTTTAISTATINSFQTDSNSTDIPESLKTKILNDNASKNPVFQDPLMLLIMVCSIAINIIIAMILLSSWCYCRYYGISTKLMFRRQSITPPTNTNESTNEHRISMESTICSHLSSQDHDLGREQDCSSSVSNNL